MSIRPHVTTAVFATVLVSCSDSDAIVGLEDPPAPAEPPAVVEETRPIADVRRLRISGAGALYIRQGPETELRIRSQAIALEHLSTEVQDGELSIGFEGSFELNSRLVLECFLTVPTLEAIETEGLWKIEANALKTGTLSATLGGIVEVGLADLEVGRLVVVHSSPGDVTLSGRVRDLSVEISGHGSLRGQLLSATHVTATLWGRGSATAAVRDTLRARIEGSGSFYYFGDPVVRRTGSGSGHVVKQGP